MTAETLRRAAALMRERAEAATGSSWQAVEGASGSWWVERPHLGDVAIDLHGENAQHIAAMTPAVALAVADLLEDLAETVELALPFDMRVHIATQKALRVALRYLGENESFGPQGGAS